ncbi:MAG: FCD domain-containing protein [Nevskiales bacterium]
MRVEVARGIISLRENLAPSVAQQAAKRAQAATADELDRLLAQMRETDQIEELQELVFSFWDQLVQGSGNIAYKLAFNSLRKTYKKIWGLLTLTLAEEFRDSNNLALIAAAVRKGKPAQAEAAAKAHIAIGSDAMHKVLDAYQKGQSQDFAKLDSLD